MDACVCICRQHVVPKRFDVLAQFGQSFLACLVIVASALPLLRYETSLVEHAEVLRHGRLRDVRPIGQFTHGLTAAAQLLVQPSASGIGECDEHFTIRHGLY
jgi:hypothetical protein